MPTCRVFQNLDGTIRVMRLNERHRLLGETDASFFTRETAKQPGLFALPFIDVDASTTPTDRGRRYAWRVSAGAVIVDLTVPVPAHPRQALFDEIDSATTLVQLRAALRKVVLQ